VALDLKYYSSLLRRTITVPVGFETDFASIPRLPFAYALLGSTATASAVIHDYLVGRSEVPWIKAAQVFLEAMEVEGISWWRRRMMYLGLRLADLWRNTDYENKKNGM